MIEVRRVKLDFINIREDSRYGILLTNTFESFQKYIPMPYYSEEELNKEVNEDNIGDILQNHIDPDIRDLMGFCDEIEFEGKVITLIEENNHGLKAIDNVSNWICANDDPNPIIIN